MELAYPNQGMLRPLGFLIPCGISLIAATTESPLQVAEVVPWLERAISGWDGIMQSCAQIEDVDPASPEPISDSVAHREFRTLTF